MQSDDKNWSEWAKKYVALSCTPERILLKKALADLEVKEKELRRRRKGAKKASWCIRRLIKSVRSHNDNHKLLERESRQVKLELRRTERQLEAKNAKIKEWAEAYGCLVALHEGNIEILEAVNVSRRKVEAKLEAKEAEINWRDDNSANNQDRYEEARAEIDCLRKGLKDAQARLVARETELDRELADRMYAETRHKMALADLTGRLRTQERQLDRLEAAWPCVPWCASFRCRECGVSRENWTHAPHCTYHRQDNLRLLRGTYIAEDHCGTCNCDRKENYRKARDG